MAKLAALLLRWLAFDLVSTLSFFRLGKRLVEPLREIGRKLFFGTNLFKRLAVCIGDLLNARRRCNLGNAGRNQCVKQRSLWLRFLGIGFSRRLWLAFSWFLDLGHCSALQWMMDEN